MPIYYDITRLPDGKFIASRRGKSGKVTTVPTSFTRSELENFLKDSVSKTRLEQALLTLDTTGHVPTIEADLETT
jgi:hypothetical protein